MTMLQTNPGSISVATTDYPTIECDVTPITPVGATVVSAAVRIETADSLRQVAIPDAPTWTTTTITQPIKGAILTPGVLYRVKWIPTFSDGQILSQQTSLVVPY